MDKFVVVSVSLFPAIIKAKSQSKNLYHKKLQQFFYDFMVWIAILIAIPMTFMANWIVNALYGSAFNVAGDVLIIHIWSDIF